MKRSRFVHCLAAVLALAVACLAGAQDFDIVIRQFGVGSMYRPGEVTGMQLEITNNLPETMPVWVQWDIPNADGDIEEAGRSLTLTSGRATTVWLYAPLSPPPRAVNNDTIWTVRVFEERDQRKRGELAATRVSPALAGSTPVPIESSMIGVVGANTMGLEDYDSKSISGIPRPEAAHEPTRVVRGITPAMLPDRWDGLKGFEAIAWSDAKPSELRIDQAAALREYVQHGGHLIIDLPQIGDPWSLGVSGRNELEDLLPARSLNKVPRRDESVPLLDMLPILSKSRQLLDSQKIKMAIRVFKDLNGSFDAIDNYYEPLIALPDGRVVVVRRTYGHGFITVIGIDLSRQLSSFGIPHADVFWNRILGRRIDTPTQAEIVAMNNDKRLTRSTATEVRAGSGVAIEQTIALSGEASRALLLALFLFGAYWLLAGPLGFAILRKQKISHHAWVAFVVAIALFTAIAWGSVSLLRTDKIGVKHVTFLDYIAQPEGDRGEADPQLARCVSWLSVYLNKYGPVQLGLEPSQGVRNELLSWAAPRRESQPFPNIDRYTVDVGRDPTIFGIPARSTTTQLYANWMGPLDRDWGGMISASANNPVDVTIINGSEMDLTGTLQHSFPSSLTNVLVIWVKNVRITPRTFQTTDENKELPWSMMADSGKMLNVGSAWIVNSWDPDTPFDLKEKLFSGGSGAAPLQITLDRRFIEDYKRDSRTSGYSGLSANPSADEARKYFEMLSVFSQLKPPEYLTAKDKNDEPIVAVSRDLGRELDLSAWFTRPCLIVIGRLENSATPLPLRIEGEEHETSGLTIVRWIYPLPLEEEIAFSGVLRQDGASTASEAAP